MSDRILLQGLEFYGYHGVRPEENALGQRFIVDVEMVADLRAAGKADDLARTVDYAAVYADIRAIVEGPTVKLIETVAETIADTILSDYAVASVRVRVRKPDVPIEGTLEYVGVEIERIATTEHRTTKNEQRTANSEQRKTKSEQRKTKSEEPAKIEARSNGEERRASRVDRRTSVERRGSATHALSLEPTPLSTAPAAVADDTLERPTWEWDAPTRAYLSLGSNSGDRLKFLARAVHALGDIAQVTTVSPVYETQALGENGEAVAQPSFLNCAVAVETELSPRDLMAFCARVEQENGRNGGPRWQPRSLDIDLLLYGDAHIDAPDLTVPHPRMHERAFVLQPLVNLDPALSVHGVGRLADRLSGTVAQQGIRLHTTAAAFAVLVENAR